MAELRDLPPYIALPEVKRSREQGFFMWPYFFKIWRCSQLVHKHVARTGVKYDAVVWLRPDQATFVPWKISRVEDKPGTFELNIGPTCRQFSQRDLVIRPFTFMCANEGIVIGTYASMTVAMDLIRFCTSNSRWFSPKPEYDNAHRTINGGELPFNFLSWRTGTHLLRAELYSEMSRLCMDVKCVRTPTWLKTNMAYGCAKAPPPPQFWGNNRAHTPDLMGECTDHTNPNRDMEWGLGYDGGFPPHIPPNMVIPKDKLAPSVPPCTDVPDLAMQNPLGNCSRKDTRMDAWKPTAHRIRVLKGYGVPLILWENGTATPGWGTRLGM